MRPRAAVNLDCYILDFIFYRRIYVVGKFKPVRLFGEFYDLFRERRTALAAFGAYVGNGNV